MVGVPCEAFATFALNLSGGDAGRGQRGPPQVPVRLALPLRKPTRGRRTLGGCCGYHRGQTNGSDLMALKSPQQYVESLRDGRVTYWDGERIDDITKHPKFRVPIEVASRDYDHRDSHRREVMTY